MLLQAKSILAASSQKNQEEHPTATEVASMSTSTSTDSDSSSSSSSMRNSNTNHHSTNSTTKRGGHAPTAGPAPVLSSFGTNNSSSSSSSDYDDGNNNNTTTTTMIPNNDVSSSLLKGVRENDVLCGRSEVSHIGNKKYRRIIEDHREAYQNASSRRKKTELSYKIIVAIRATGGRFLKMDDESSSSSNGKNTTTTTIGKWMELDDKQAKEKVSHALRSAKDPDRPRQRKPRVVKKHVPTAKEKMLYHHILRDQQELFRVMMKKEGCDVKDLVLR